jgi:hypothetical protein
MYRVPECTLLSFQGVIHETRLDKALQIQNHDNRPC